MAIVSLFSRESRKCDICGLDIKRTYHEWKIGGKKQILCPNCNSQMERKVSRSAFKNKFG